MKVAFVMVGESEIEPGVPPTILDESGYVKTPDDFHAPEFELASKHGAIIKKHGEDEYSNFCPHCGKPTDSLFLSERITEKVRECNILSSYNCIICDENESTDEDE